MSQENLPGGRLSIPEPVLTHLPIDLVRDSNRAGHTVAAPPGWEETRRVREAAALEATRDPAAETLDPLGGVTSRFSTQPVTFDVRRGFEDIPNLGKKGPERAPRAQPDPLQTMEDSPTYVRPTVRVTPGAWDEALLTRRTR